MPTHKPHPFEGLILTEAALNAVRQEAQTSDFQSVAVRITEPFTWHYNELGPFYFVPLQPSTIDALAKASLPHESPSDTILRIIAKHNRRIH
jgi:hypothetical protein